jgi:hypothetical protein
VVLAVQLVRLVPMEIIVVVHPVAVVVEEYSPVAVEYLMDVAVAVAVVVLAVPGDVTPLVLVVLEMRPAEIFLTTLPVVAVAGVRLAVMALVQVLRLVALVVKQLILAANQSLGLRETQLEYMGRCLNGYLFNL